MTTLRVGQPKDQIIFDKGLDQLSDSNTILRSGCNHDTGLYSVVA